MNNELRRAIHIEKSIDIVPWPSDDSPFLEDPLRGLPTQPPI